MVTVRQINEDFSHSTRGLIKNSVQQDDLTGSKTFLLPTFYFSGQSRLQ